MHCTSLLLLLSSSSSYTVAGLSTSTSSFSIDLSEDLGGEDKCTCNYCIEISLNE